MNDDISEHIKSLRLKGLPQDLRDQIKSARHNRKWGQRDLAAKAGLTQSHISAIESGEVAPRLNTLLDILRVLDLDLLLVPRALVPAVHSLIHAHEHPELDERPLYAVDEQIERSENRRDET
jgi:transcriptional regulator with XRE-family HTH domain